MKPCVVVTREMGSEGDAVALEACELTGYRLIQAHAIGKLAGRQGLHGTEWRWLDQGWYRLFARLEEPPAPQLAALRPVLLEACTARRGTLFLGRGIGELLHGYAPLFRVHVVAPFEVRVVRIARQVNVMRSRAEERVRRSDDENAWFYRATFGIDWNDPTRYDLLIDTGTVTVGEAVASIVGAISGFREGVHTA